MLPSLGIKQKSSLISKVLFPKYNTWWTFRIFFVFFCSGEGKGEFEEPGGRRLRFLIENPRRRGGGFSQRGGGDRGAGRVSAGSLVRGGDLKFFFRGRSSHQEQGEGETPLCVGSQALHLLQQSAFAHKSAEVDPPPFVTFAPYTDSGCTQALLHGNVSSLEHNLILDGRFARND